LLIQQQHQLQWLPSEQTFQAAVAVPQLLMVGVLALWQAGQYVLERWTLVACGEQMFSNLCHNSRAGS